MDIPTNTETLKSEPNSEIIDQGLQLIHNEAAPQVSHPRLAKPLKDLTTDLLRRIAKPQIEETLKGTVKLDDESDLIRGMNSEYNRGLEILVNFEELPGEGPASDRIIEFYKNLSTPWSQDSITRVLEGYMVGGITLTGEPLISIQAIESLSRLSGKPVDQLLSQYLPTISESIQRRGQIFDLNSDVDGFSTDQTLRRLVRRANDAFRPYKVGFHETTGEVISSNP